MHVFSNYNLCTHVSKFVFSNLYMCVTRKHFIQARKTVCVYMYINIFIYIIYINITYINIYKYKYISVKGVVGDVIRTSSTSDADAFIPPLWLGLQKVWKFCNGSTISRCREQVPSRSIGSCSSS